MPHYIGSLRDLMLLCWLSSLMTTEMDATGGQSLYPLHRSKTLHLVCWNLALLQCFLLCRRFMVWYLTVVCIPLGYYFFCVRICVCLFFSFGFLKHFGYIKLYMYTGKACPRDPQCGRGKRSWCILVLWSFWCTTHPSWLEAGSFWLIML